VVSLFSSQELLVFVEDNLVVCVVQTAQGELSTTIREQLVSLKQRVNQFRQDNQNVNVTRLSAAVDTLEQTAHDLADWYVACYPNILCTLTTTTTTPVFQPFFQNNLGKLVSEW